MPDLVSEVLVPKERISDLIDIKMILDSIDREIDFLRKRSGYIYFFLFLVEGLFLVGDRKLVFPIEWDLISRVVNSILFAAIGFIGRYLGVEYRDRIHQLKDNRKKVLENCGYKDVYPHSKKKRSEIKTLYWLLFFLSGAGVLITLLPIFFN